jgi:hypothetical protein
MTVAPKIVMSKKSVEPVSFLPAFINHRAQPYVVAPAESRFGQILKFTEWVSNQHPHRFRVEAGEVIVDTAL